MGWIFREQACPAPAGERKLTYMLTNSLSDHSNRTRKTGSRIFRENYIRKKRACRKYVARLRGKARDLDKSYSQLINLWFFGNKIDLGLKAFLRLDLLRRRK
jgi:hypothetical protein